MLQDLRYALRTLRKNPGFTALVAFTLALGIGANAAIFSIFHTVLLRPLPYAEPDRLVRIFETFGTEGWSGSVSVPNFRDWREQSRAFETLVAYQHGSRNLQGVTDPERLRSVEASGELFEMLGVPAMLGRVFQRGEDAPELADVAVLSEALWRRRFAADPAVVGKSLMLDGRSFTVLGVMPERFSFPAGARRTDLWLPFVPSARQAEQRGSHFLAVVGRLKHDTTLEQAKAQLEQVARRLEEQYPEAQSHRSVRLVPLRDSVVGRVRGTLFVLMGAVGLVLLIACANVANLSLARALTRRRDVAIRAALGASRGRLMGQFLLESLVLALGGAVLGALLAHVGLRVLAGYSAGALPDLGEIRLDALVFAYLLGVAVLTGVGFGLVPALGASRADLRRDLVEGAKATGSTATRRLRSALVVAEIALSLVLLVSAGLLLRTFWNLQATPPGLDPRNVLTMHVALSGKNAGEQAPGSFLDPVLERIRAIPGVRDAGLVTMLPIQSAWTNGDYTVEGKPDPPPGREWIAELRIASPGYFEALGVPLKAGRTFTEADGTGPVKVIVNEALVRRHFGKDEDPIGQHIRRRDPQTFEIVGVVGDVRQAGLDREPMPEIDFPYNHPEMAGWLGSLVLVVKSHGPVESIVGPVRSAVLAVDPEQPVFAVLTMDEILSDSLARQRLYLWLLATFAGIALLLSAAGLYGVISYLVAQRTRELGIRVALGASRGDVLRLVLGQGLGLLALGTMLGLAGAFAATRLLEGMLYGVGTTDPRTFLAVVGFLGAVALAACLGPARRAMRVDPVVALRCE
jgi:putative ABC transport system permease protein